MLHELADSILNVADSITLYFTMWLLIGVGLFLTIRTRFVQIRLFRKMISLVVRSRGNAAGGISSFQAFTISLAARVGVGNVFGVAAALLFGGPGAIFWMWIVALVGMATAFFEATLAQIFKVKGPDGSFRGGPAYYLYYGLRSKTAAMIFAVVTAVTCAFSITMVQSNAIAGTIISAGIATPQNIAIFLFFLSAPVIFGGVRTVARVTEVLAPAMAVIYLVLALIIVLLNFSSIPGIVVLIVESAFAPLPLVGGLGGGILAAIINGTKRGLFSNEAGQGTAPNAAATATVAHPVQQGLIQSLGVFVDTILVCSATAFVILLAGAEVWSQPGINPGNLTSLAVAAELGSWTAVPMAFLIGVLAFSSIIAAYVYSEVNIDFITTAPSARWAVRITSVVSVVLGALLPLPIVWNSVDIAMAVMTISNLIALVLLAKWGVGALRDYEGQLRKGIAAPVFSGENNPLLPGDIPGDIWKPQPQVFDSEK